MDGGELDCRTCGACCHGDDGWVSVDRRDDARIAASPALASLVVLVRQGSTVKRSLRMVRGACAALVREGRVYGCSIYAERPRVCRELDAGSAECLRARKLFSDRG